MTRQQDTTAHRLIGIALAGSNRSRVKTDGEANRAQQRAIDRRARKANADAEREVIAARRGTKLSARDTFTVLNRARLTDR